MHWTWDQSSGSSTEVDGTGLVNRKDIMRIFKNDLTHYFIRDHRELPASYLRSCNKFFRGLSNKHQAPSLKQQALKNKLHKPGHRVKNRFNRKI